jgi:hypothetical protein
MMWRTAPEPSVAMILRPDTVAHRLTARSRDRQRLRLVGGLRSVARRSHTAARARRYDVLLYERAAAVRPQLLQSAATLDRVTHPQPETLETLRWLLTDGCSSPLYNPDVPAAQLPAALDRIQAELDPLDPSALPSLVAESQTPRRVRGT